MGYKKLDKNGQDTWSVNIENYKIKNYFYITYYRRTQNEDIENYNKKQMPGFQYSWNYSNNVVLKARFKGYFLTNEFARYKVCVFDIVYLEDNISIGIFPLNKQDP